MGIFKQLYKTFVSDPQKKKELLDWLVEHDTPEYHKNPLPVGYEANRLLYEEMESVESLEQQKQQMLNYYTRNKPLDLNKKEDKDIYLQRRLEKIQEDF
jgi:hypothetical protein